MPPADEPPDPKQQAAAHRRHRRTALIAALTAVVLAAGGWSWWHFTRPAPADVSIRALTGWSDHPSEAWRLTVTQAAGERCSACTAGVVGWNDRTLFATVGTGPLAGGPDISGTAVRSRVVAVDQKTGKVTGRSPWLAKRVLNFCDVSTTTLWCTAQDTSDMKSLADPGVNPQQLLIRFDRRSLQPAGEHPAGEMYPVVLRPVGSDLLAVGSLMGDSGSDLRVVRYAGDGRVRWTRTVSGPTQNAQWSWFPGSGEDFLQIRDGAILLRGFADYDNHGVTLDLATGKPAGLPAVTLARIGRATVTTSGPLKHTFVNKHDTGIGVPAELESQLTTGARPVVLTGEQTPTDVQDALVGVDVRDDGDGSRLWMRPGQVPVALCGDRLVVRAPTPMPTGDPNGTGSADPGEGATSMTVLDLHTGAQVAAFVSDSYATSGGLYCAPRGRLVAIDRGRVRTIDLATGKDSSAVATDARFGIPVGNGLLLLGEDQHGLQFIR